MEKNTLITELKDFNYNKIWVTKKVRMEAEQRRIKRNEYLNYFLIYYTASLSIMSFLNLYDSTGFNLALFSSMISLVIPSVNMFQYKSNYSQQALEYRNSYLELSTLEDQINSCIANVDTKNEVLDYNKVQKFKRDYATSINKYINHTTSDYHMFLYKSNSKDLKLNHSEINKIRIKSFFFFLGTALLILLPLVLIYLKLKNLVMFL